MITDFAQLAYHVFAALGFTCTVKYLAQRLRPKHEEILDNSLLKWKKS